MLRLKSLRYLPFVLLILTGCKFSKFTSASDILSQTTDPTSDNNNSSQASSCSVSISKNDFSLSETIAINLNYYAIQSLSYNINDSNDWFSIPTSAINSRQIIFQAADLGTGSFHLRLKAQDHQQALIECQGNLLIQVRSVINPVSSPIPNPMPVPSPSPTPVIILPPAQGDNNEFVSVHQIPFNVLKPDYSFYPDIYKGFKNQFNPTSATGCRLGLFALSNLCAFSNTTDPTDRVLALSNQLRSSFYGDSQHWSYNERNFKIYIPKGSTKASGIIFLPQKTRVALVASIDRPPTKNSPLTLEEYSFNFDPSSPYFVQGSFIQSDSFQSRQVNSGVGFDKMLNGSEIVYVHDGGGVMSLFPELRSDGSRKVPLENGHWIYIRVINFENDLINVSYSNEVHSNSYQNWYSSARFDFNGDPL